MYIHDSRIAYQAQQNEMDTQIKSAHDAIISTDNYYCLSV